MKKLYKHLQLKRLKTLKALGVNYVAPPKEFQEHLTLPDSLEELSKVVKNCHLCQLSKTRTKTVFGEGNKKASLMFIGEAPGASEDSSGHVFVGRAGELLTKMIENVLELKREEVYITNILKCRPPNNRAPLVSEALSCKPYLLKEIELINPKIIVTLGSSAYHYLTNDPTPISKVRGHLIEFNSKIIIPTYHPSYLLRNPSAKKETFADLLQIKKIMQSKFAK